MKKAVWSFRPASLRCLGPMALKSSSDKWLNLECTQRLKTYSAAESLDDCFKVRNHMSLDSTCTQRQFRPKFAQGHRQPPVQKNRFLEMRVLFNACVREVENNAHIISKVPRIWQFRPPPYMIFTIISLLLFHSNRTARHPIHDASMGWTKKSPTDPGVAGRTQQNGI